MPRTNACFRSFGSGVRIPPDPCRSTAVAARGCSKSGSKSCAARLAPVATPHRASARRTPARSSTTRARTWRARDSTLVDARSRRARALSRRSSAQSRWRPRSAVDRSPSLAGRRRSAPPTQARAIAASGAVGSSVTVHEHPSPPSSVSPARRTQRRTRAAQNLSRSRHP